MSKTVRTAEGAATVAETNASAAAEIAGEMAQREAELKRKESELAALMAQLEAKQKAADEREAAIQAAESRLISRAAEAPNGSAATAQTESAPANPADEWGIMKTIQLPRAPKGEENYVYVNVNDRSYQVPRGKPQQVALPVYERLKIMLKARDDELDYIETVPNEAGPQ